MRHQKHRLIAASILVGAIFLVFYVLRESTMLHRDQAESTARETTPPSLLVGAEPDPAHSGPPPSVPGPDPEEATIRFRAGEDSVADIRCKISSYEGHRDPRNATSDEDGIVVLSEHERGSYCVVSVPSHSEIAAVRLAFWAEGETVVELSAGCEVFLQLDPQDADLLGTTCQFFAANVESSAPVDSMLVRIGRVRGGKLRIGAVGSTVPMRDHSVFAVPRTGETVIPYVRQTIDTYEVSFRAPGPTDELAVHVSWLGYPGGTSYRANRDPVRDVWAVHLPPAQFAYLGAVGDLTAAGIFSVAKEDQQVVPLWQQGCRVHLVAPSDIREAHAYVLSMRGEGGQIESPQEPSVYRVVHGAELVLTRGFVQPQGRAWPQPPAVSGKEVVWPALPHGSKVRFVIEASEGMTLIRTVRIRTESAMDVHVAAADLEVRVTGSDDSQPCRLDVFLLEERRLMRTRRRMVGRCYVSKGRAWLRGVDPSWTLELVAEQGGLGARAVGRFDGARPIELDLVDRLLAPRSVRVLTDDGHPVAGAVVNFSQINAMALVRRTDVHGTASVMLPPEHRCRVRLSDARFVAASTTAEAGGVATLIAAPAITLTIVSGLARDVDVRIEIERGRLGRPKKVGGRFVAGGELQVDGLHEGPNHIVIHDRATDAVLLDHTLQLEEGRPARVTFGSP